MTNYDKLAYSLELTVNGYKALRAELDKLSANEMLNAKIYLLQQMAKIQEALLETKKTVNEIEKKGYYTPKETA